MAPEKKSVSQGILDRTISKVRGCQSRSRLLRYLVDFSLSCSMRKRGWRWMVLVWMDTGWPNVLVPRNDGMRQADFSLIWPRFWRR